MDEYKYYKASSMAEAVKALSEADGTACVLAGGTDLMVAVNHGRMERSHTFVDIGDVPGLLGIEEKDGTLNIGSMVTAAQILESSLVREKAPALWMAAKGLASPQVRNRATIGGNIGTASPSGDFISALIALGAEAALEGSGKRVMVQDITVGVKTTSLGPGEIISSVGVPLAGKKQGSAFVKTGKRKAMTISIANVAAWLALEEDGKKIKEIRIAVGACAPTVVRIKSLEDALAGADVSSLPELSFKIKDDEIQPITDQRATAWYRREVVPALIRRAVIKAAAIANGADPGEEAAK